MMGKGHFTKFTLLHAVIIHIPARFLGHTASMLQYLVFIMKLSIPTSHFYFEEIFCIHLFAFFFFVIMKIDRH